MEKNIKTITKSNEFSFYNVSVLEKIKTYILSTPETRELTTNPLLVGKPYRDALGSAIKKALSNKELSQHFKEEKDEKLNVVHLLRGGLNFQILEALGEIGKPNSRASFMSSERALENNEWKIRDDNYTKLNLEENSNVFIGDIIATGSTLKKALEKIEPGKIKNLFVFTLGGEEAEKILQQNENKFDRGFLVYIEGIFHMAKEQTPARIKIPGTDLMPLNALLSPEFEQELLTHPIKAIERCIVYDGGSRGFHPSHHLKDVLEYIKQLQEETSKGATLYDLILDRWQNIPKSSESEIKMLQDSAFTNSYLQQRTEKLNTFLS